MNITSMGWGGALLLLFGALAAFCLVWIVVAEANQDSVIHEDPQPDSRRDAYRNFERDWK
jgi:hypothetical protein